MRAGILRAAISLCFFASVGAEVASAQLTAQITGTITDQSGAVIPGARVVVINEDTGLERPTQSNAAGGYTVPLLQPGNYRITVSSDGFRGVNRPGVRLAVAQTAQLDFVLEVGAVTDSVEVIDTAPLLDTGTNAMGGLVESDKVENLPIKGRNSMAFMMLVPGTRVTRATTSQPVLESHYQFFSVNGSRPGQNQFMLDGGNNSNVGFNSPEYSAQVESVAEFKVQTSNFSAEYANAAGAVINIVTKGGTNELHGSLFEYFQNDVLNANNFFSNAAGQDRPAMRYNQFGGTLGGPIVKNKTFFYGGFEALRVKEPFVSTTTVPTPLQRSGDFSQTLTAAGAVVAIYDPFSTIPTSGSPGRYTRTRLPNNAVPQARINPISAAVSTYYPSPNLAGNLNTGLNNYFFNGSRPRKFDDYSGRIDHQLNDKSLLMGRFSKGFTIYDNPNTFGDGNLAGPYTLTDQTHTSAIAKLTQTFSPTLFGEFVASFSRFFFLRTGASNGFDPTELGFPSYLAANSRALNFPTFSPAGMVNAGGSPFANDAYDRYETKANLSKFAGNHTLKFGGLWGLTTFNSRIDSNAVGTYAFGSSFTQGPDPFQAGPNSGIGYATMLLGTPTGGTHNPSELHTSNIVRYFGMYLQDDFKVSQRLTLNLGLRYDYEGPRTERRDELANFDFNSTATLSNGVEVRGGPLYPGVNGIPRGHWKRNPTNFAPRFGFAYGLTEETVVRGGYGIFFSNSWGSGRNGNGIPPTGFICSTPLTASIDGGLTPYSSVSDPFPDGFCKATRNTAGLLTNLGQTIDFIDRDHQIPYSQSWNLDIQRKLPKNIVLSVTYAGSRGVNLLGMLEWNQLAPEHLSLGSELNSQIGNPYYGVITEGPLAARTITLGQSLRPYPQFLGVSSKDATYGSSVYHAMYAKVERRFAYGFSLLASYTWSKLIDDLIASRTGFPGEDFQNPDLQNFHNRRGERALASWDTPQNLVVSAVYEMPMGPGKSLLNGGGVAGKIIGGWQVNSIVQFQSGPPRQVTGGNSSGSLGGVQRPNWSGENPTLEGPVTDRLEAYFDTSVFYRNDPFTFGNAPRIMPNLRAPGTANFDLSLFKNVAVNERFRVQIRAEFFNTLNRVQFGPPNTDFNANSFGVINSQVNSPRSVQLALKLLF